MRSSSTATTCRTALICCKALRQTQSNAKSVAFAVVNGKTTTQEAFQSGANFVLQKPLTPLHASRCFNAALNFMVRERRRYFRHPVEMPLRISLPGNQEVTATATNLSEGGMAIRILGKLPKDAQAQFRFTLPDTNISLELKGQVAWADGTGHVGIRFVEVPQSSQYQLEKWLTDRLQRRNARTTARLPAHCADRSLGLSSARLSRKRSTKTTRHPACDLRPHRAVAL